MHIKTAKSYEKAWVKLSTGQQKRVLAAIELFLRRPRHPRLRHHQLKGKLFPHYSISAGGNLRIHYLQVGKDEVMLVAVGTHAQLYE